MSDIIQRVYDVVRDRQANPKPGSYTNKLFTDGEDEIVKKVGEEAVEMVIEAKDNDENLFLNESADLLFHYLILLQAKGYKLNDIEKVLQKRH